MIRYRKANRPMPHPKPRQAVKTEPKNEAAPPPASPRWKVMVAVAILVIVGLTTILWSSGFFKNLMAGPKTPLPRQVAGVSLGMSMDQVFQVYPAAKKALRPYNDDPLFKIASLKAGKDLSETTTLDLVFFKDRLYFASAMWEADKAKVIPIDQWVNDYRRWDKAKQGDQEALAPQVNLKEWHFTDGPTEMVLRDLNYPDHIQRWQDIRDSSSPEAQAAFAKYRLETGG